MSEYGKLWQQVSNIRVELKKLIPDAKMDSLETAKKERDTHVGRIDFMLASWADIEREMEKEPP